jgi:hypothetical protein
MSALHGGTISDNELELGQWLSPVVFVQLSRQVFDLLDRIFVVDEEQRITIKQVEVSAWREDNHMGASLGGLGQDGTDPP